VAIVAGACGLGVLGATLLPWYGIENMMRIGGSVQLEITLWGDDNRDLALAIALLAGVGLCAFTAAIRITARPTRAAWLVTLAATLAFVIALLIVIERVTDPPGASDLRYGALVALVFAIVAGAAAAIAALLSRRAEPPARPPAQPSPQS
jgi:hypothetical protein